MNFDKLFNSASCAAFISKSLSVKFFSRYSHLTYKRDGQTHEHHPHPDIGEDVEPLLLGDGGGPDHPLLAPGGQGLE